MRLHLCLGLVLAVAGCQKNESTPRGTEILSWTAAQATRRNVASAKEVGPRVIKDLTLHARPERKGAVKLAFHVETAPIEVVEGDRTVRRTVPLVVQGKVAQNSDWTLTASCGDGPHNRLPTVVDGSPVTPEAMGLPCNVGMRYEDSFNELAYSIAVEIGGDGAIKPTLVGGAASIE